MLSSGHRTRCWLETRNCKYKHCAESHGSTCNGKEVKYHFDRNEEYMQVLHYKGKIGLVVDSPVTVDKWRLMKTISQTIKMDLDLNEFLVS